MTTVKAGLNITQKPILETYASMTEKLKRSFSRPNMLKHKINVALIE